MTDTELAGWIANRTDEEREYLTNILPSNDWDMSKEREFIENLLCQRVNFFLIFVGIIVAGAASTNKPGVCEILLGFGFVISTLLALPIMRAQSKLDIILDNFLKKTLGHPVKVVDERANLKPWYKIPCSMRRLLGYAIPLVVTIGLGVATFLVLCGYL